MKADLDKIKKKEKKFTKDLPEDYKILDVIIKGRNIRVNIQEMLELANVYNEAEVLAAMNKACSNYHYFARMESELEDIIIEEEEKFELQKASRKSKYTGKEYTSEASRERELMNEHGEWYQEKTKKIRELNNYKKQAKIAKSSLEKQVDMIKSINSTIRKKMSDPGPTSESD